MCDYIENLELVGRLPLAILKFKPGTTNGICVCIGSTDDFDSLQRAHILAGSFTPCRQVAKSAIPFFFSFLFLVSPVLSSFFFFLFPRRSLCHPKTLTALRGRKVFTSD